MSLMIVSTFFSIPTKAEEVRTLEECEVAQNRFNYIDVYKNRFEISENGKASLSTVMWARNTEKIRLKGYLQQYINGRWVTIKSWSSDTNGTEAIMAESWFVISGYSYRYQSYAYLYNGGRIVETTNYLSDITYYQ